MLESLSQIPNAGGLQSVLRELQGLKFALVTGAAAADIAVPGLSSEDTLLAVLNFVAGSPPVDLSGNITSLRSGNAAGKFTCRNSAPVPVEGDTMVVNGHTYTWRAIPKVVGDVKLPVIAEPNSHITMATNLANAINEVENARTPVGNQGVPVVTAKPNPSIQNEVYVTAVEDGPGNAIYAETSGATIVISGAGPAPLITATLTAVADGDWVGFNAGGAVADTWWYFKDAPVGPFDLLRSTDNAKNAQSLAKAINSYAAAPFYPRPFDVKATVAGNVVTVTPGSHPKGNNISFSSASAGVPALPNTGFLGGGTKDGYIRFGSDPDTVLLVWFAKK